MNNYIYLVAKLSNADRVKLANEMNRWNWPAVMAHCKPDGFDGLPNFSNDKTIPSKMNNESFRGIIDAARLLTSEFDISAGWWAEIEAKHKDGNHAEEEHAKWWASGRTR